MGASFTITRRRILSFTFFFLFLFLSSPSFVVCVTPRDYPHPTLSPHTYDDDWTFRACLALVQRSCWSFSSFLFVRVLFD